LPVCPSFRPSVPSINSSIGFVIEVGRGQQILIDSAAALHAATQILVRLQGGLTFLLYYELFLQLCAFSALTLFIGHKSIQPVKKTEWWGAGMVICLERGVELHMAQLMPLSLTVSCFSKIQIGFTFLVLAYPGSSRKRAIKQFSFLTCDKHVVLCHSLISSVCAYLNGTFVMLQV